MVLDGLHGHGHDHDHKNDVRESASSGGQQAKQGHGHNRSDHSHDRAGLEVREECSAASNFVAGIVKPIVTVFSLQNLRPLPPCILAIPVTMATPDRDAFVGRFWQGLHDRIGGKAEISWLRRWLSPR